MKTNSIIRPALLLCLSSLLWACSPQPQEEEQAAVHMDRAYAIASLQAHKAIRNDLRELIRELPELRDTMSFMEPLHPMMMRIDSTISTLPLGEQWTARDTLMHSASDRLFTTYHLVIHEDVKALFLRYSQLDGEIGPLDRMYIDSIMANIQSRDAHAMRNYELFLPQDSSAPFDLEPLIP